jgi:hypothetical protein
MAKTAEAAEEFLPAPAAALILKCDPRYVARIAKRYYIKICHLPWTWPRYHRGDCERAAAAAVRRPGRPDRPAPTRL